MKIPTEVFLVNGVDADGNDEDITTHCDTHTYKFKCGHRNNTFQ